MRPPVVAVVLLAAMCVWATGDRAWAKKSRTPVTAGVKQLDISPQELRIRVRALIRPTLGIVEETADRIRQQTQDPASRRGVVILKIETTTTLLSAMLRNDPVLALADAWGYAIQVQAYLARPQTAAKYGATASEASAAMATIQSAFRLFVSSLQAGSTAEGFEAVVRKWADANPIEGALYRRPAMDTAVAHLLASSKGGSAFAALGSLDETTSDVLMRMDLYTMYLPRLARWEAELTVDDLSSGVDAKDLVAEFERFTRAADRIAAVAETAPQLVAGERAAALAAVTAEREAILRAVNEERIATLQEMEAITQRLVDRTSGPLHEGVRQDLTELIQSVEAMRKRLIDDAGVTLEGIVDHAFRRAVQLLFIAAALAGVGLVVYARVLRR